VLWPVHLASIFSDFQSYAIRSGLISRFFAKLAESLLLKLLVHDFLFNTMPFPKCLCASGSHVLIICIINVAVEEDPNGGELDLTDINDEELDKVRQKLRK
jgi:hypothetical protein